MGKISHLLLYCLFRDCVESYTKVLFIITAERVKQHVLLLDHHPGLTHNNIMASLTNNRNNAGPAFEAAHSVFTHRSHRRETCPQCPTVNSDFVSSNDLIMAATSSSSNGCQECNRNSSQRSSSLSSRPRRSREHRRSR